MNWGCICFDLDNTLIDYEKAFKKGMIHTFHHFFEGKWVGMKKMEAEEWFPIYKKLCNDLFPEMKLKKWTKKQYQQNRFIRSLLHFQIEVDREMASDFQNYFYSTVHLFVEPFKEVPLLFRLLEELKIPFGMITNGRTLVQYNKIKSLDFEKWFSRDNVFISEEYGVAKPNAALFNIAHRSLNRTSFPSLYIGDSWELDIVGAINAGWDAIYLNTRSFVPTTNHHPIQICRTMNEILEVVGLIGERR